MRRRAGTREPTKVQIGMQFWSACAGWLAPELSVPLRLDAQTDVGGKNNRVSLTTPHDSAMKCAVGSENGIVQRVRAVVPARRELRSVSAA